jgi:hypothetical protein
MEPTKTAYTSIAKNNKLTALQKKKLKKMSTGEKVYSSHEDHMDAMHKQLGIGKYRNQ